MGTPSTTINGWLSLEENVVFPLILMYEAAPAAPDELVTWTPLTLAERPLTILLSPDSLTEAPLISSTPKPNAFFSRVIPPAVTTTSSSCSKTSGASTGCFSGSFCPQEVIPKARMKTQIKFNLFFIVPVFLLNVC